MRVLVSMDIARDWAGAPPNVMPVSERSSYLESRGLGLDVGEVVAQDGGLVKLAGAHQTGRFGSGQKKKRISKIGDAAKAG
jgi:hypothetical protein